MDNPIRTIRKLRGWTQEKLAEASGQSVSIISAYERGSREYTLKTLGPIAQALGVRVADLLDKEGVALTAGDLIEVLLDKIIDETQDESKRKRIQTYLELIRNELSTDSQQKPQ